MTRFPVALMALLLAMMSVVPALGQTDEIFFPSASPSRYGLQGLAYIAGAADVRTPGGDLFTQLRKTLNLDANDELHEFHTPSLLADRALDVGVVGAQVLRRVGTTPRDYRTNNNNDENGNTYSRGLMGFNLTSGAVKWTYGFPVFAEGERDPSPYYYYTPLEPLTGTKHILVCRYGFVEVLSMATGKVELSVAATNPDNTNSRWGFVDSVLLAQHTLSDGRKHGIFALISYDMWIYSVVYDPSDRSWAVRPSSTFYASQQRPGPNGQWINPVPNDRSRRAVHTQHGLLLLQAEDGSPEGRFTLVSNSNNQPSYGSVMVFNVSSLHTAVRNESLVPASPTARIRVPHSIHRVWEFNVTARMDSCGFEVSHNHLSVYLSCAASRFVRAYSLQDGRQLWQTTLDAGFYPHHRPAVGPPGWNGTDDSVLVLGSSRTDFVQLFAFRGSDGTLLGRTNNRQYTYGTNRTEEDISSNIVYHVRELYPVLTSSSVVFRTLNSALVAFNKTTLAYLWGRDSGDLNTRLDYFSTDAVVFDGNDFFITAVYALTPASRIHTLLRVSCPTGSSGTDCLNCEDGFYFLGGSCQACPPEITSYLYLLAFLVMVVLLFVFARKATNPRIKAVQPAMMQMVDYIQLAGQVISLQIDYPPNVRSVLNFMSFVNLNIDAAAPECTWRDVRFIDKYYFFLAMPGVLMLACVFVFGVLKLVQRLRPDDADRIDFAAVRSTMVKAMMQLLMVAFLPIFIKVVTVFDCTFHEAGATMDAYPSTICFTSPEWAAYIPGVIFGLFYLMCTLSVIVYVIYLVRRRSGVPLELRREFLFLDETFVARVGFIFDRYKPMFVWWELCLMLRKCLVGAISLIWTTQPIQSAVAIIIVFITSVFAHAITRPFARRRHTLLDIFLGFCIVNLCTQGITIRNAQQDARVAEALASGTAFLVFFFAGIAACIVVSIKDYRSMQIKVESGLDPRAMEPAPKEGRLVNLGSCCGCNSCAVFRRTKDYEDEPQRCRIAAWQPRMPVVSLIFGTLLAVGSVVLLSLAGATRTDADSESNQSSTSKSLMIAGLVFTIAQANVLYYPGADLRRMVRNRNLVYGIGQVRKLAILLFVLMFVTSLGLLMTAFKPPAGQARQPASVYRLNFNILAGESAIFALLMHLDFWLAQRQMSDNWMVVRKALEEKDDAKLDRIDSLDEQYASFRSRKSSSSASSLKSAPKPAATKDEESGSENGSDRAADNTETEKLQGGGKV